MLFGKSAGFLLGSILGLLAHEDFLELLRENVYVPGKKGEEIRVIKIDVGVELVLLVGGREVDVHGVCYIFPQNGYRLSCVYYFLLFSLGDYLSLWIDLKVFTNN